MELFLINKSKRWIYIDLLSYSEKNSEINLFVFILFLNSSKTFIFESLLILSSFKYLKKLDIFLISVISSLNLPFDCLTKIIFSGLSLFIINLNFIKLSNNL